MSLLKIALLTLTFGLGSCVTSSNQAEVYRSMSDDQLTRAWVMASSNTFTRHHEWIQAEMQRRGLLGSNRDGMKPQS
ncbi:MAG: hypothetical protein JWO82_632 [Akkermansiaceae bacterium]|nr:hypothetical protein [Akkermansiaceae bacterium]